MNLASNIVGSLHAMDKAREFERRRKAIIDEFIILDADVERWAANHPNEPRFILNSNLAAEVDTAWGLRNPKKCIG